jgi:hypothetical protein
MFFLKMHEAVTATERAYKNKIPSWRETVQIFAASSFFFNSHSGGVESKLGPLGTSATELPIVPTPGDYDDGEFGEMKDWKGKPKYIVHHKSHLTRPRARTRVAAVESQRLTA